jgi:molecular chaperone GrpE
MDIEKDKKETVKKKKETVDSKKKPEKKKVKKSVSKETKKIKELEEKLKTNEEELEKYKDQLLRTAAEFDNYKRRTEKESLQLLLNANEKLIIELLPVIDDLSRTLEHADSSDNGDSPENADSSDTGDSFKKGVELVFKKLMTTMEKQGLKEMASKGEEFDTDKHHALIQVDSDEFESGYITDEHLKGYTLNDKVIRHAQVLVAK